MKRNLASYIDGELPPLTRMAARLHLQTCPACFEDYEQVDAVPEYLAGLAPAAMPANLRTRIQVAASYESARRNAVGMRWERFKDRLRDGLRPMAIQAAGGAAAAMLLFGMVMPDLWMIRTLDQDVPLTWMAQSIVKPPSLNALSPLPVSADVRVLAFVDVRGDIYKFETPGNQSVNPELRAAIANALLMSDFKPATKFGRPVLGQVLITFSRYTVRG